MQLLEHRQPLVTIQSPLCHESIEDSLILINLVPILLIHMPNHSINDSKNPKLTSFPSHNLRTYVLSLFRHDKKRKTITKLPLKRYSIYFSQSAKGRGMSPIGIHRGKLQWARRRQEQEKPRVGKGLCYSAHGMDRIWGARQADGSASLGHLPGSVLFCAW